MSDKMREEFEEWLGDYNDDRDEHTGEYLAPFTSAMWQAWQASRAALVVDLSDLCEASYTFSGTCYKSDVEYRLDCAGVTYK